MVAGCILSTTRESKMEIPVRCWRSIMTQSTKLRFFPLCALLLLMMPGCSGKREGAARRNVEESQALVLLRGLPTLGTAHSVAIVDLNPEAANFGAILQEVELPNLALPMHHLYYSPNGRLYSTGLDPKCSLAEIGLSRNANGAAVINGVKCLDTGGQQVGEDIIWHSVNGKEYMFVTFMGGTGVDQPDCGSVGVFDPQSNAVIKIIQARKSGWPRVRRTSCIRTACRHTRIAWWSAPRFTRISRPASATRSPSST